MNERETYVAWPRYVVQIGEVETLVMADGQPARRRTWWEFAEAYTNEASAILRANELARTTPHVRVVDRGNLP